MKNNGVKQIKRIIQVKGYDKIVLNFKKRRALIINGIKGSFIPEILCYVKNELKAIVTFIKSLENLEEIYKLTLFIEFTNRNHLCLYIVYNQKIFSKDDLLNKLIEKGLEIPKHVEIIGINYG